MRAPARRRQSQQRVGARLGDAGHAEPHVAVLDHGIDAGGLLGYLPRAPVRLRSSGAKTQAISSP